jgi:hypothetical protein
MVCVTGNLTIKKDDVLFEAHRSRPRPVRLSELRIRLFKAILIAMARSALRAGLEIPYILM